MLARSRIVWKLSLVFVIALLVAVGVAAWFEHRADEQVALRSAREASRLQSRTVLLTLKNRMLCEDTGHLQSLVSDIAAGTPRLDELRLVTHEGKVVASRAGDSVATLTQESRSCRACHETDDPDARQVVRMHEELIRREDGERVLAMMTPVFNEPACKTADCHAHADSRPVLGLIELSFNLGELKNVFPLPGPRTAVFMVVAALLTVGFVWVLASRLLERPIRSISQGMRKLGEEDIGFRFDLEKNAEFATLAESFNAMADKLEATLEELRDTRDYFEGIVENSADMIVTVNPGGYVYTFNRGAEDALGYTREEMIGRRVDVLFAEPAERVRVLDLLKEVDSVVNYETRLLTKGGDDREVILTLSRLLDPEGNSVGTFGIAKDVTEANRMHRKLLQSERLAAIGQALAGIQHSMKNMLNAMKGGAYMVRLGLKKGDMPLLEEGWGMVEEGIANVTNMSTSMLSYVKEWKPEFEQVDVVEMIRKIEGVFRQTAEDQGVSLRVDAPEDAPTVYCDGKLVHTAVMDILSNALDAVLEKDYPEDESPELAIWAYASASGSDFAVAVQDNGCGMTPEVRANVFTPFFSTKRKSGTGLGLALTARTIRLHGGEIEVESEPNVGTEFRIILPTGGPNRPKEMPDGQEGAGR